MKVLTTAVSNRHLVSLQAAPVIEHSLGRKAYMQALDRVLALLEAVAASDDGVTMSAAAFRTRLNLATVSRFMKEMAAAGLLTRSNSRGTYQLGPRLVMLAQAATRKGTVLGISLPVLQELRDASGETASLHVRVGDRRVCLAVIESRQEVRRVITVGFSLPLLSGATGQTLLANLLPAEQVALMADLAPTERGTLAARLAEIRRSGYAWATGTAIQGVSGVAAPILNDDGVVAVLSVSGPSFRWTEDQMRSFAPTLAAAAQHVSQLLLGGDASKR